MSSEIVLNNKKQTFLSIFSGVLLSVASTLIMILLFALVLRYCNISDSWIFPVNQVIKIISVFLGVIVALKKSNKHGFLKGILLGIVYFK